MDYQSRVDYQPTFIGNPGTRFQLVGLGFSELEVFSKGPQQVFSKL
tara:strand:- start:22 stop:159 length:138 start_codon:yes stop_codon:yes gene_type:complete